MSGQLTDERVLTMLVRLEERMDEAEKRTDRSHAALFTEDAHKPGLLMRVDRIERLIGQLAWIGRGGLVGLAGTLALLWRIGSMLADKT